MQKPKSVADLEAKIQAIDQQINKKSELIESLPGDPNAPTVNRLRGLIDELSWKIRNVFDPEIATLKGRVSEQRHFLDEVSSYGPVLKQHLAAMRFSSSRLEAAAQGGGSMVLEYAESVECIEWLLASQPDKVARQKQEVEFFERLLADNERERSALKKRQAEAEAELQRVAQVEAVEIESRYQQTWAEESLREDDELVPSEKQSRRVRITE